MRGAGLLVPQEIGWSTATAGNLQMTRVSILLMEMLASESVLHLPSGAAFWGGGSVPCVRLGRLFIPCPQAVGSVGPSWRLLGLLQAG